MIILLNLIKKDMQWESRTYKCTEMKNGKKSPSSLKFIYRICEKVINSQAKSNRIKHKLINFERRSDNVTAGQAALREKKKRNEQWGGIAGGENDENRKQRDG